MIAHHPFSPPDAIYAWYVDALTLPPRPVQLT